MWDAMGGIESVAQARNAFCAVNPYCLESILRLAQESDVVACCDIVDEEGGLLLARGATLSRTHQAALHNRRLRAPLEASLDLAPEDSLQGIVGDCLALVDEIPALALLGGGSAGERALRAVAVMPVHGPLQLLLTLTRRLRPDNYRNSLAATIIGAGLAHRVGLSEYDSDLLILSALFQDLGEAYIDPQLLDGNGPLPVQQWRNVAAHPLVGHAFLTAFTNLPPALADCVLQHHERQDGNGYPFQRVARTMTPLGTLIGLADCVSALVMGAGGSGEPARDADPGLSLGERVAIALTIVANEFPPAAVASINAALAPLEARGPGIVGANFAQRILPTLQQIRSARLLAQALSRRAEKPGLARIGSFALSAIHVLDKRLRMTGVYDISQLGVLESDAQRMGQTCLVLDEVKWRLRHLARSVYLRTGYDPADLASIAELVAVLGAAA